MPRIEELSLRHDGWMRLYVASIRLPDGQVIRREIEDHGDAVAVLPFDPERRVALLVRQFRAPPFRVEGRTEMLEVPAGRLDEADPEAGVRREAMEEAGLRLRELDPVCVAWSLPALCTERAHLYLAPYAAADRVAAGGGLAEESEAITVVELPLPELAAMADRGEVTEMKLLVLLQTLRLRRPELFAGPP